MNTPTSFLGVLNQKILTIKYKKITKKIANTKVGMCVIILFIILLFIYGHG